MKEVFKSESVFYSFFFTGRLKYKSKAVSFVSALPVDYIALLFCTALAGAAALFFLLITKPLIFLPADILMFAETDFVGNIIKLNTGRPLYTDPSDSNSIVYNPAAFLVTYAIALVTGQTKSVVGLRLIQIGFVACSALIATVCARKLYRLAFPDRAIRHSKTWTAFIFLSLFLAATAPHTNKFVYALHVDALALLVSVTCFWSLLRYAEDESLTNLFIMALLPAAGFLTKQSLVVWIAVMFVFLLFRHPKNFRRLGLFVLLSAGFAGAAFAACYLLWGENYIFWTYKVLASRNQIVFSPDLPSISIARSFDHLIRVWPELLVGIVGCWFLLKYRDNFRRLGALAAAWLVLVASQTYSSGSGWGTLYHFGPGVLTGAIFMFAAFPHIWESRDETAAPENPPIKDWARMFVLSAAVIAVFLAWNVMPTGDREHARYFKKIQPSPDLNRYVREIEREFAGMRTEKVLLGVGNWIYLRDGVLQKDRAISLADQPPGGIYENFDVTIGRIKNGTYEKILVQDFHSPYFLYDWGSWSKSSGFRAALLENYVETRQIKAPEESPLISSQVLLAGTVSVFVRRE